MLDRQILVPIVLFLCVTYAFRAAVDAVVRYRMLKEGISQDLLSSILTGEQEQRRMGALRWGIFLVAIGIAVAITGIFGWTSVSPAAWATVMICGGIGQLIFHRLSQGSAS